ncbi:MAG: YgfZ/GcvT domain-containing protein [Candidatus Pelagibacter sp.]
MNKNNAYILEDRGIIYANGNDIKDFLQNIVSNDISKVTSENSCFASLLTPQGKYLFDFIIVEHKNGFFLDCEKKNIELLLKQLQLYKLRSKVEFLNLSNEFVVTSISKEKFLELNGSEDKLGHTIKFFEDPILLDPRTSELGARLVINLEKLHLSLKKLELKSSNIDEYHQHSHNLGIPPTETLQLQNKIFGIECNFDKLNAIDFKKGCYVGQENTARINLKDKLNKRLFAINIIEGSISNDNTITFENKEVGKILINDKYSYAILKYKEKKFDYDSEFVCGNAKIKIIKPIWL